MSQGFLKTNSTLDKVVKPKLLYKYRKAGILQHTEVLSTGKVYYAHPSEFDDKTELENILGFNNLTEPEIIDLYYHKLKKKDPFKGHFLLLKEAEEWAAKGNLSKANIQKANEEVKNHTGIYSMCYHGTNDKLWKDYSNNYDGFCVGFDSDYFFVNGGGAGDIDYVEQKTKMTPLDDIDYRYMVAMYSKQKNYKDEEEYRASKFFERELPPKHDERKIKIEGIAYKELIIGYKVSQHQRDVLIKWARLLNPNIEIKIASPDNGKVLLTTVS